MTSNGRGSIAGLLLVLGAAVVFSSCATDESVNSPVQPPDSFSVQPVSVGAVKVVWTAEENLSYRLERRVNLAGEFRDVPVDQQPNGAGLIEYFDTDVEPETFYGYRLRAVDRLGSVSRFTPVRGAHTPPPPGILVETHSPSPFTDPDGYTLTVTGTGVPGGTLEATIGVNDRHFIQPLPTGTYDVALSRIADICARSGGGVTRTATATVDATGLNTMDTLNFIVNCSDPTKASITTNVTVTGTSNNVGNFRVDLEGIANGQPVLQDKAISPAGGSAVFGNLVPGDYQVILSAVDSSCGLTGPATQTFILRALDDFTADYAVSCEPPDADTTGAGYKFRGSWARNGNSANYTLEFDLTGFDDPAIPGPDDLLVISGITRFDDTKLAFTGSTNVTGSPLQNQGSNLVQPGAVAWFNADTDAGLATGNVGVIVLTFDVLTGASGSVKPATTFQSVDDVQSENGTDLKPKVIIIDRSLDLGSGSGQPTARANGPYTGTVGVPIAFSSAGSSAAAGRTIAGYAWDFGDGTTSTQASPGKTYSVAGGYTATLTITDDLGGTASGTTTVTVNAVGGGSGYVLRGLWSAVAGGQTTYTLTYDLTQRDDPAIPGIDDLFVISGITQFDNAKLSFVSSSNVSGSLLQNQGSNLVSPGNIAWFNADTDAARATGSVGVIRFTFSVLGGATGTVTPVTSFQAVDDVQSENGVDLKPNTTIQDGVLTLSGGGSTPPTAEANGPYNASLGTPITFSSAGSTAAAGRSLVTYLWSFGDNTTSTLASPAKSYAAAGVYQVTLTVTDDQGESDSDQASAVVAALPGGPVWRSDFSAVNPADSMTTLTVSLDLTADVAETPGSEALATFVVDSITWNPAVLQYRGYSWINGNFGSVVTSSGTGRLTVVTGTVGPGNATGVVEILTIRFKAIGAPGVSTATLTDLGPLIGTAATGNYNYLSQTSIVEATVTVP